VPALVEDLDDEAALEIAIIENLQREDLSPLEEATMYDRMVREHGYSIRKLADKLGKDKGYLENRLRLADAPEEIRELVSVRKDTLSHAYELMKVTDEKKRRRLAARVASGELSLVKLRERIDGRRPRSRPESEPANHAPEIDEDSLAPSAAADDDAAAAPRPRALPLGDDSLVSARHDLADAVEELVGVLREPDVVRSIAEVDRANLVKYLTITKLKIENAIALVRSGDSAG
jgi:ParB-like chromosome segregation protein Spo0J